MLGGAAEAGPDACQKGERQLDLATEHIAHLGGIVEQLVHAHSYEVDKHELGDGAHTRGGRSDGCPNEGGLG